MKLLRSFLLLFLFPSFFSFAQNRPVTDSLERALKGATDTMRVNICNHLSVEFRNSDLHKSDSFSTMAIEEARKLGFDKGAGYAYINKGFVHRNFGEYDKAMKAFRWALFHFVRGDMKAGYWVVYKNIAALHHLQGNYSIALFYYFQALKVSEELHDRIGMAKTMNNIGVLYIEQEPPLPDKALNYYTQSYNILLESGDENGIADCLNNIGNVYQEKGNHELAVANYKRSIEINQKLGDIKDVSAGYHNIGFVYHESGDYRNALEYFHQSLQMAEKLGDIHAVVLHYTEIADCYINLGMFHAALKYAAHALEMSRTFNMRPAIKESYEMLYRIEEAQGNFKEALRYHEIFKAYNDSLFSEATETEQQRLEAQYILEKTEKEKLMNTKEAEMYSFRHQEKEKEISQYILIIGLVLLLFVVGIYVAFFLFRRSKYS